MDGVNVGGIFLEVRARDAGTRRDVTRIATQAAAGQDIKLNVRVDDQGRLRDLKGRFVAAGGGAKQADQDVSSFRRTIKGLSVDAGNLRTAVNGIQLLPLAAGALAAANGLEVGAAGAVALAAGLAPVVGLAGTLPGLLAAVGQGAGTLGLGLSGIGDAVKALGAAEDDAGHAAGVAAGQQQAAAERVRAAQERVRDSTIGLADRQRDARRAQQDLTRARIDARQRLAELSFELRRASLDEEDAALSLRESLQRLNEVRADPRASILERQRAELSVKQARAAVDEIRHRNQQMRADAAEARRAGVEGDRAVVQARERVTDANRAVTEAARDLKLAQQAAGRAAATTGVEATAAARKVQTAFDKLSPAGQRFARFLFDLRDEVKGLKAEAEGGLFPGFEQAITAALPLLPDLQHAIGDTADELGDLAVQGGRLLGSGPFRRDFRAIAAANVDLLDDFGAAGLDVIQALVGITHEAIPLTGWLGELARGWAADTRAKVESARASGRLAEFFELTRHTTEDLLGVLGDVGGSLFEIAKAGQPLGTELLGDLRDLTAETRAWLSSAEGQVALRDFFDDARASLPAVLALVRDVAGAFGSVAAHAAAAGRELTEFLDEHPKLRELFAQLLAISIAVKGLGLDRMATSLGAIALKNPGLAKLGGTFLAIAAGAVVAYEKSEQFRRGIDGVGRELEEIASRDPFDFGDDEGARKTEAFLHSIGDALANLRKGFNLGADNEHGFFQSIGGGFRGILADLGLVDDSFQRSAVYAGDFAQASFGAERQTRNTSAALRDQRAALDRLNGAVLNARDAQTNLSQAQLDLRRAQARVNELQRSGKRGTDDYTQATLDLRNAQSNLVRANDSLKQSLEEQRKALQGTQGATVRQVAALVRLYRRAGIKPPRALLDFLDQLKAREDKFRNRSHSLTTIARLQEEGVARSDAAKARHLIGLAEGGRVRGQGTGRSDSNLARLSTDEWVHPEASTKYYGPRFMSDIQHRRIPREALPGYAAGGRVGPTGPLHAYYEATGLPGSLEGGYDRHARRAELYSNAIAAFNLIRRADAYRRSGALPRTAAALRWAQSQEGKPYIWGGVGPRGFDCSGLQSALTNVLLGRSAYHRVFATGSFPPARGWAKGYAPLGYNIGSFRGNPGHMAATLAGVNVESRGGRGVVVGAGARGARHQLFHGNVWHLAGRTTGTPGAKERLPGFRDGAYLHPNSPRLAMVGDNPRHGEAIFTDPQLRRVIADAVAAAMAEGGGGGGPAVFVLTDQAERELFRLVERQGGRQRRNRRTIVGVGT